MIKKEEFILHTNVKLVADGQTAVSHTKIPDQAKDFIVYYSVAKTGTPPAKSYTRIEIQHIDSDGNAYTLTDGLAEDLLEEVTFVPVARAVPGKAVGSEIRVKLTGAGTLSTSNYFTVNARIEFMTETRP